MERSRSDGTTGYDKDILPLAPPVEPVPFRGQRGEGEVLPFFEEMDAYLRSRSGAFWSVLGPSGIGKTCFARWAAARWGKLFLEDPDENPGPLWIETERLELPEGLSQLVTKHPFLAILEEDEDPTPWKPLTWPTSTGGSSARP